MTDFSTIKKLFHIKESNGFTNDEIQIVKDIFGELPRVFIDFFTAMAYLQARFALQFSSECYYELEEEGLDFISKNYKNKGVSFKQWLSGINFYGNHEDDIIIVNNDNQLFYSANSEVYFVEMDKVLSKLGTAL